MTEFVGERSAFRTSPPEADWFEEWFGVDYLRIYQHRDESDAERAIELIERNMRGHRIDAVLDLACGAGRHTRILGERWWTVGLDLFAVAFFQLASGIFLFLTYNYWSGGLPWYLADCYYVGDFGDHLAYFHVLTWPTRFMT